MPLYVRFMFHTYIITNKPGGTLYTGHTDDISHRMQQHQAGAFDGFAAKYGCKHLVWYEAYETRGEAFQRERQIKKWNRGWKLRLIEEKNEDWLDLATIPFWPLLEKPITPDYQQAIIEQHRLSR